MHSALSVALLGAGTAAHITQPVVLVVQAGVGVITQGVVLRYLAKAMLAVEVAVLTLSQAAGAALGLLVRLPYRPLRVTGVSDFSLPSPGRLPIMLAAGVVRGTVVVRSRMAAQVAEAQVVPLAVLLKLRVRQIPAAGAAVQALRLQERQAVQVL